MQIFRVLIGLFLVVVGTLAVVDGDLWNNGEWIFAGAAAVIGISGLASAVMTRS